MFWKRQIPIAIVALIGTITLFGWFTDQPNIKSFIDDDATQWFDILASFAIFLGALNLMKLQSQKIIKRKKGWKYSLFAILGFSFSFSAGFIIYGNYTVNINSVGETPDAVAMILTETTGNPIDESKTIVAEFDGSGTFEIDKKFWTNQKAIDLTEKLNENGAKASVASKVWGAHLNSEGSLFYWMFMNFFKPLQATMFALLAFTSPWGGRTR